MEVGLEDYRTEVVPDTSDIEGAPHEKKSGVVRFLLDVLETLLLSVLLFAGINAVSARIRVEGSSMQPTLYDGEYLIVNRLAYKLGSPAIGDIIVFHPPRDLSEEYIKRVIGLPGDRVVVSRGKVTVNDQPLDEPYIAAPPAYNGSWTVPANSLFVLGDNRNNSSDSHSWGPVQMDEVIGRAVLVYWPPSRWGFVKHLEVVRAAP
jgi:signal peptidase I